MAEEEEEEIDKNKRIRPWEQARGQKTSSFLHSYISEKEIE